MAALVGVLVSVSPIWDKWILVPSSKKVGNVVTQQTFQVENWNTFRDQAFVLGGVDVAGTGNISISGPFPVVVGPGCSASYTATLPQRGDATIDETLGSRTWDPFKGLAESWIFNSLEVSGSRITLFPFDPDWSAGVRERVQWLTAVTQARSGKEQRARLRTIPRRALAWNVTVLDERLAQVLEGLLTGWQSSMFAVPWWPEQVVYSGTMAAGATSIPVSTAGTMFVKAPMVLVWVDPLTCEVQTVQSVGPSAVTCSALQASYTNPLVVPVFPGRLPERVQLARITPKLAKATVEFACEVTT